MNKLPLHINILVSDAQKTTFTVAVADAEVGVVTMVTPLFSTWLDILTEGSDKYQIMVHGLIAPTPTRRLRVQ